MKYHRIFAHAVLFAVALTGCNPSNPSAKVRDAGAVKTDVPTKKAMLRVIEQPATIEAFEETPLVAHISGYLKKVNVDIGKLVAGPCYDAKGQLTKAGEILAELAVPEMLSELEQKQALVTQARAQVDQSTASLDAAEAHVLTAKALVREATASCARADANVERWKSELVRVEKAVKDGVLDRQIREETLFQYKSADASRNEVEAKVQSSQAMATESEAKHAKAKADVAAAKAHVLVAGAEEARLKALVEYRYIRAPFDGVVTRRNIHTGHFLQSNASGGPGVLFVVARTDKLRIIAEVPESDATYITENSKPKIHVPALKGEPFEGVVARTSRTLDPKSRTLRVEIDHVNSANKLRPGMFANLVFTVDLGERYTLPVSAIFTHADQPCCWRVVEGKAVRTPLKLGVRDGQMVEVVKLQSGGVAWQAVSGDEQVVVTNLGAVSEGKEVRVEKK